MKSKIITTLATATLLAASAGATLTTDGTAFAVPAKKGTAAAEGVRPFATAPADKPADKGLKLKARAKGVSRAKALDVPFIEDFSSPSTLGDWGIQDVNNDGNSWEYSESFGLLRCYFTSTDEANDDWVITPGINLGKDDVYTLSFSYGSQGTRFKPEHLTVTMGTSEYGTRHTTVLFDRDDIQNFWNGSMETVTVTLPVEEDGTYYFGFHSTSPKSCYCLYLDDVRVEQNGTMAAPEAVSDLKVTAGAGGAPGARVSFKAPLKAASGQALTAISDIKVYRDQLAAPVKEFADPTPGAELSFDDSGLGRGMHSYRVVASINGEEGAAATASAYIGIDKPKTLTGVRAVENADGSVTVSWDAAQGENGGYTGADAVTYTVARYDGSEDEKCFTSATNSFTDSSIDTSVQLYCYYTVTATTEAGSSEGAESNALHTGPAYAVPFTENFAYGTLGKTPWTMQIVDPAYYPTSWSIVAQGAYPSCPPVDGDDGMLQFLSTTGYMNLYAGGKVRIATPTVSLKDTKNPWVSFYLFHYDTSEYSYEYNPDTEQTEEVVTTYNDNVKVQVSVDDGPYTDVADGTIALAANNNGWTEYRIPLAAYKGADKVSVGLLGYADGGGNIYVDRLKIGDDYAADLEVVDLLGPQSVAVGQSATYTVNIRNNGTTSTKNYTVGLWLDEELLESKRGQGAAIFADGGEKTLSFTFTPRHKDSGAKHRLTARIAFADDECPANNIGEAIELDVPALSLPTVESVEGRENGNSVTLSWDEPDIAGFHAPVVDDMEGHQAFAISGIGGYTLVDNDKSDGTYGISGIQDYPNAGAAMAWQVFNPQAAGVDLELGFNRKWIPYSGQQCLVSWAAYSQSGAIANDDWLISPELSGEAQRVSFRIKAFTQGYTERFRVLYSTDTKSTSDFVKVAEANYYTPSSRWREFSVKLPEGAKYFAIHCISNDAFALMVDNVSYEPSGSASADYELLGYNVYRDGEKLNAEPLAEQSYTDADAPAGSHSYTVTTLFAQGESSPSAPYLSGSSAVADVDEGKMQVRPMEGCVEISGIEGAVCIWNTQGMKVAEVSVEGSLTVTLPAGLYIVSDGRTHVKTAVR